ncbi:hypothetical protein LV779_03800 [Streptomyces thinghirensis]|nr:hypothetical protein [Streptomyces thinghirensis]
MAASAEAPAGRFGRFATPALVALSTVEVLTVWSDSSRNELLLYTASALALLVRRRWPLAVLLATLPVATTGYVLFPPMAAMYQVARDVRDGRTVGGCAVLLSVASPPGLAAVRVRAVDVQTGPGRRPVRRADERGPVGSGAAGPLAPGTGRPGGRVG